MSSPVSVDNISVTAVSDENEEKPTISVGEIVSNVEEKSFDSIKEAASEAIESAVNEAVEGIIEENVSDSVAEVVEAVVGGSVEEVAEKVVEEVVEKIVDEVFDGLVSKLDLKIGSLEITPQSVMSVVRFAMEVVEATELKGNEQKDMVLRLLRHAITVAPISDEKEALCLQIIDDGVVSNTIDIIVAATQGELEVNTVVENVVEIAADTGCCGLFAFLQKRK